MRILITNDDGINAPGLEVLTEIATEIAGPEGEVWTVAPAFEQSGVGHCISYTHPMMIAELGPRRFAAEGSPADCVLAAIYDVLDGRQARSGAVGREPGQQRGRERALFRHHRRRDGGGVAGRARHRAVAVLRAATTQDLADPFETRAGAWRGAWCARCWTRASGPTATTGCSTTSTSRRCPGADVKGMKVAAQGFRRDTAFGVEPHMSPSGRKFLWIKGGPQHTPTLPGTDAAVNLEGYHLGHADARRPDGA